MSDKITPVIGEAYWILTRYGYEIAYYMDIGGRHFEVAQGNNGIVLIPMEDVKNTIHIPRPPILESS